VSGEVEFGPAIRETDGGWTQYGGVPPKGAVMRFTRYRHGGGRDGNVTADTLSVLKSTIAGVDTVNNPEAATGGVDAEIIRHARQRAAMEIRSRYRAVTAEDFEFMAGEASPRVARAVCIPPNANGPVPLHLVPRIYPADRRLSYEELMPDEDLLTEVAEYLDERRLIGTQVELKPCRYRGLSVVVNLQARPMADTARVEEDVAHALYTYLNPLVGGNATGPGGGWPFGRALNQGELYGVVHAVDGVEFVRILRIYETNLETGEQSAKPAGTHIVLEPDELMASGQHIVKATHRED
jgi:predicted phage baseplate assembly protein